MGFQHDRFGHQAYRYTPDPSKEQLVERSPDKRPSDSDFWYLDQGRDTTLLMEVKGLGVVRMRCTGGHDDGKIRFEGVAIVTKDEILFD